MAQLTSLTAGMQFIHSGGQVFTVSETLASTFESGDHLMFVHGHSDPLVVPASAIRRVDADVQAAIQGFYDLSRVSDAAIDGFYDAFSARLMDDTIWSNIAAVNKDDVRVAKAQGRSTTRLVADEACRQGMVAGLQAFKEQSVRRVSAISEVSHDGWSVDLLKSPLGVVGFVFEGRPNVISDATGVLKSGNSVVFRVGRDALPTARAIMDNALYPALDAVGISRNAIRLIDSPERATAWALFSNTGVNLAVARGSGSAVRLLGGIAQQYGIPVSLHGTGGAWMMTSESTSLNRLHDAIVGSLDRKVCNTLNTICVLRSQLATQQPAIFNALKAAGDRLNQSYKVHIAESSMPDFSDIDTHAYIQVTRADGNHQERQFELLPDHLLGTEWEWEATPEISLVVVDSVDDAIALFNQYSPQFVASLITESQLELVPFFNQINAPFVGNGMTRWVDGQYALNAPELGLSNWESGRFLARSAILSGDSVFTTRIKMTQIVSSLDRVPPSS
jgi:glutamate-5-semialdehyde dehydrogenase